MAKIALLIGVSEYEQGLNALPSAVNDVTAMRQVLTNPNMGGFAGAAVTVLRNPNRQTMEDAIYTLFANRQKEDLVLLYFSGHGVVDDSGEFYFASRNTCKNLQGKLVPTSAVAIHPVQRWMEQSRSQHKVIILDSCFSGAFAKGVKAKDSGSVNPERFLGGKGTAILTASTSTQYALTQEGFDLSIYTHYLVEGIRTGGADQDDDGFITMEELHTYASSKVKEAAPAMTPEFYPVKEGYKILLAKSPKDDPRLKYRKQVEQLADQGTFSIPARRLLNSLRTQLKLAPEVAGAIEAEVLQPYREYQRKLQEYEQTLVEALQAENPLRQRTLNDLKDYQQHLALEDADIQPIRDRVIGASLIQPVLASEIRSSTEPLTSADSSRQKPSETGVGFFERCTEKAIKVIMIAQEESRRLGHNFVGEEQIFLGLIGEGTGIAAKALKSRGINLKDARIEVEKVIGRGSGFVAVEIPFTPRAKRILELSSKEARQLEHRYIGTEHLLLGLLREGEGVGVSVLKNLGVDLQNLRNSVLQTIAPTSESDSSKQQSGGAETTFFGNFTEKSIRVLMLAQEESRRLGHNFVGTEQILLGLIGEGTGVAARILASQGIQLKKARFEVEKIIGRGSGSVAAEIPFTPRGKRLLELSKAEAYKLGHNYVATEHLLLGLSREGEGVAVRVLENLGMADVQALKNLVLQAIDA
jgi:uncharacterized caspase-like protein